MSGRERGKALGSVIAAAVLGMLWVGNATAQELVRVDGRVEWIAGQTMVVAPYGMVLAPAGTSAINIDLSQAPQGDYTGLATGDSVTVTGTVPTGRDRVVARSIERLPSED